MWSNSKIEEVSQNCFVLDVVKQNCFLSDVFTSFWMLSTLKNEEDLQNSLVFRLADKQ